MYALFGVVLIPISFLAIRLANDFIHPVVFTSATGRRWPARMFVTFCVSLAACSRSPPPSTGSSSTSKRLDVTMKRLREALE